MKTTFLLLLFVLMSGFVSAQSAHQKIYDTERAFERTIAEKGINAGFLQYLSPYGVMFFPGPENAREVWAKRPASPAVLTWNPIKIEVSSNGALGYSIGNSVFRANGKTDVAEIHGHYLSVWTRQPNGEYLAALDTGINHEKPVLIEGEWKPGSTPPAESNAKNTFAADSSLGFYEMVDNRGAAKAYRAYAAEDIYLLRDGKLPFVGRNAALDFLDDQELPVKFAKRKSFIEAGDLAYVYSSYALTDKKGIEQQRGSFVQVWRLRGGRWQIVADIFIPIPPPKS